MSKKKNYKSLRVQKVGVDGVVIAEYPDITQAAKENNMRWERVRYWRSNLTDKFGFYFRFVYDDGSDFINNENVRSGVGNNDPLLRLTDDERKRKNNFMRTIERLKLKGFEVGAKPCIDLRQLIGKF